MEQMRVYVCVSEYTCVQESLGLWNQTNLGSVLPLALPLGLGFYFFCESEDEVPSYHIV